MGWIQDRKAEQQTGWANHKEIFDHAHEVYDALWNHIKDFVDEAKGESIEIYTNGAAYDRIVRTPVLRPLPGENAAAREIHVKLAGERTLIVVTGFYGELRFEIGVCKRGFVGLKFDGQDLSLSDAAIKILDPLLFPDLPRKY